MRAVRFHNFGGPEVLRVEEAPLPVPAAGQVLIRVAGTSYNPGDALIRSGVIPGAETIRLPHIPSVDVAGTIVEVGAGVRGNAVGDQVIAYQSAYEDGGAAEFVAIDANMIAPAPTSIPLSDGAALPVVGLTAWQAVHEHLGVRSGQKILINGAGGGVGRLAVQLAKAAGATVIATAGPASVAAARSAGADEVIDYTVDRPTGPVDAVFNTAPVAERLLRPLVALIRPGGSLVSITSSPPVDPARQVRTTVMVVRRDAAQLAELAHLVDSGVITVGITERLPITETAAVHHRAAAGKLPGKIVLTAA
ncbi:NADP-dependent oxidoreductase [Micromonospora krabiensis]|uniref:NADPH:quinone reductase n=1 Tax=Micromonospora krabiensis TaxID=307121 RepID=A0A1C3MWS9_9ACTN|nr:NADP-dependent oxidoreductase [Micromonospora krabiensis]SBV24781.1 NADPH:quinone reductase [Micromonospora krabiensis]